MHQDDDAQMISVDVVIPVFNGGNYITRALDSLSKQTFIPAQVIVVDDGSTDNTVELAKNYLTTMENLVILTDIHAGLSAARNRGILESVSDYITFLDCDDYWSPDKIANQVSHIQNHSTCSAVFSNCYIDNEMTSKVYLAGNNTHTFSFLNIISQRFRILGSASSICIKRSVLQDIGLFDEKRSYGEDYELWVRLSQSYEICEIQNLDVYITIRQGSMQTTKGTGMSRFKNTLMYLDVWSRFPHLVRSQQASLEKLIFPDIFKAVIKSPKDLSTLRKTIEELHPEIFNLLFSSKSSTCRFFAKNLAPYLFSNLKRISVQISGGVR